MAGVLPGGELPQCPEAEGIPHRPAPGHHYPGGGSAFDWEAVYSFEPYTSREEIARTIGFDSPEIAETIGEGVTQLIFVREDRVVLCVCAYPENLGYDVDFTGCVRYGEHTPFTVRQGSVVRLCREAV